MAEKKSKRRVIKKQETIRDKVERGTNDAAKKPRRIKQVKSKVGGAKTRLAKKGGKEYYLPLPDKGFVGKLNKRRSLMPGMIRNAWNEVKGVTWPNRSETFRLTIAVLLFAAFFGGLIAGIDYVLDNVFRRVILGL